MDITPLLPEGKLLLTGYGAGGFAINGERHEGSIILTGDKLLTWPVTRTGDMDIEKLLAVLATSTEILLLGTGEMHTLQPELLAACRARKISCDIMNTGAACRTYNVLLTEGRQVAAALIAV